MQVRLQLNDRQVDALKALHVRLTDQLLNVTSERLHISNLLQVRQQHTAYAHCTKSLPTCSSVRCCFPASLIAWHMAEYSGVSAPLKAFAWLRKCTLLWYPPSGGLSTQLKPPVRWLQDTACRQATVVLLG